MLIYINPNEKTKMTNPVLSIDKEELAKNPNTPVETQKFFVDEAKAPDGYIEVALLIDLTYNLPYRNTKGLLDFRTFTPEAASSITKVFVPMEATENKEALRAYVCEVMEYGNTDIICVDNVNIWNEKENEFVYEWS